MHQGEPDHFLVKNLSFKTPVHRTNTTCPHRGSPLADQQREPQRDITVVAVVVTPKADSSPRVRLSGITAALRDKSMNL